MLRQYFLLLAYSVFGWASPHQLDERQLSISSGDPDLTGTPYIPTPATSTVSAATPSSTVNSNMTNPIDINKFFDLSSKCTPAHQAFYKTAYEGAVAIADAARKWPMYGTAESDLYFGKNTQDNSQLVSEIPENMHRASEWNTGEFGFDDYMVLRCADDDATEQNYCGGKIGSDPRSIICYVNHTTSWGWWKDTISCCAPFFTLNDIETIYKNEKNSKQLDMRYMESSASKLLHEMMHAYRLTLNRRRIIDMVFDGSTGRRIYGPVDVAKAARIYGSGTTGTNADSYAQFANAMYWNQRLGSVPQPSVAAMPAPANYVDGVSDAEDNYLVLVDGDPQPAMTDGSPATATIDKLATPLAAGVEPSFVDGIDPSSSTAAASTKATGSKTGTSTSTASSASSTACDCNEDGCTADSPACCANGTC